MPPAVSLGLRADPPGCFGPRVFFQSAKRQAAFRATSYMLARGYSRGTSSAPSWQPLAPDSMCAICRRISALYQKQEAISDDGFASSSQLPGYEQDTTTYLRYHVYLRTRREVWNDAVNGGSQRGIARPQDVSTFALWGNSEPEPPRSWTRDAAVLRAVPLRRPRHASRAHAPALSRKEPATNPSLPPEE